jgi:hypothetical protein
MVDDMNPRMSWLLARIEQVFPGEDGLVCRVQVRMPLGRSLIRDRQKIVQLEVQGDKDVGVSRSDHALMRVPEKPSTDEAGASLRRLALHQDEAGVLVQRLALHQGETIGVGDLPSASTSPSTDIVASTSPSTDISVSTSSSTDIVAPDGKVEQETEEEILQGLRRSSRIAAKAASIYD